jgi:hypothetical protein
MTLSLAPLVTPADIYSGAGATNSTGKFTQHLFNTWSKHYDVYICRMLRRINGH